MNMKSIRIVSFSLAGLLLLASCSTQAASINVNAAGVAIHGYDPVAYFTEGRPIAGQEAFSHRWQNATWLFANEAHRELFQQNPEKYAPQYGGF